ncbi:MAG TPA: hypothetical protein V6D11_05060 [Waterburya sp.]
MPIFSQLIAIDSSVLHQVSTDEYSLAGLSYWALPVAHVCHVYHRENYDNSISNLQKSLGKAF